MVNKFTKPLRLNRFQAVATIIALSLLVKIFLAILYQYQWYFPADFSSEFLSGRQDSFRGAYRAAFYAHIIAAPLALIVGLFLLASGRRTLQSNRYRWAATHRWAGRVQAVLVLVVVVPSGLVMASLAFAGAIAGLGLAALSIATACCATLTIHSVLNGKLQLHRRWATRSCILLGSPLLLRLMSGIVLVMQLEPNACYRFNAWFSWLIPLGAYELWRRCSEGAGSLLLSTIKK